MSEDDLRECANCLGKFPSSTFSRFYDRVSRYCDRCKYEGVSPKPTFYCYPCDRVLTVDKFGYDDNNHRKPRCAECCKEISEKWNLMVDNAEKSGTAQSSPGRMATGITRPPASLQRAETMPSEPTKGTTESTKSTLEPASIPQKPSTNTPVTKQVISLENHTETSHTPPTTLPSSRRGSPNTPSTTHSSPSNSVKRPLEPLLNPSKALKIGSHAPTVTSIPTPKPVNVPTTHREVFSASTLNHEQRAVFNAVVKAVRDPQSTRVPAFMLRGRAGTGKTHLLRTLYAELTKEGKKVICVGGTAIAAARLDKGYDAQRLFDIPVFIRKNATPSLEPGSASHQIVEGADLIVWDEITSMTGFQVNFVDKSLKRTTGSDRWFGGIPVVFAGDFAQWLPEVKHASDCVRYSIRMSPIWRAMTFFTLTLSMRVDCTVSEEMEFAEFLDRVARTEDTLPCPPGVTIVRSRTELEGFVFPDSMTSKRANHPHLPFRAILAGNFYELQAINSAIAVRFPGEFKAYHTWHRSDRTYELDLWGYVEFHAGGRPEEEIADDTLYLKKGMPVILLCTYSSNGILLQRGTRGIVDRLNPKSSIRMRICSGPYSGTVHTISRTDMYCKGQTFHLEQIPVRACFAMLPMEVQGATLDVVGLYSAGSGHGDFYVALSRVTSCKRLAVLSGPGRVGDSLHNHINPVAMDTL